jgi:hypothetical protein
MLVGWECLCPKAQVLNPDVYGVTNSQASLTPVQRQSVNSSRPEFLPMARPVEGPHDLEPRARAIRG